MSARPPLLVTLLLMTGSLLGACGGGPPAPADGGAIDGGISIDGGVASDGGTPADGGSSDGGGIDGGATLETTITAGPGPFTASAEATLSFSASVAGATFECSLDGAAFTACTSPQSYPGLAEGDHTFQVRAIAAGVTDPTPAERAWTVDRTPPETTIQSGPQQTTSAATATFDLSSSEPGSTFECSFDGAPFTGCESPHTLPDVYAGSRTFAARARDQAGNVDPSPATWSWTKTPTTARIRIVAGNLTSGNHQSYDSGEGIRIFLGLKPDIALIQEMNYADGSAESIRRFVNFAFGSEFSYARGETWKSIPNGIASRYPILASGYWEDSLTQTREFLWARIDVPGPKDLWAVSIHLLTSSSGNRNSEAQALVGYIQANVPAGDYLVIGGDFNTDTRSESCISTLRDVVVTSSSQAPYPVDQSDNSNTNASRSKPYDWVLADPDLNPLRTPVLIGNSSFPNGLVFDSRDYSPLSEVAPVQQGDSDAPSMQHMAVVKDFLLPN